MRAGAFFAVAFFDTVLFFDTVVFFDAGVFDDGVFDAVLFRADGVRDGKDPRAGDATAEPDPDTGLRGRRVAFRTELERLAGQLDTLAVLDEARRGARATR